MTSGRNERMTSAITRATALVQRDRTVGKAQEAMIKPKEPSGAFRFALSANIGSWRVQNPAGHNYKGVSFWGYITVFRNHLSGLRALPNTASRRELGLGYTIATVARHRGSGRVRHATDDPGLPLPNAEASILRRIHGFG